MKRGGTNGHHCLQASPRIKQELRSSEIRTCKHHAHILNIKKHRDQTKQNSLEFQYGSESQYSKSFVTSCPCPMCKRNPSSMATYRCATDFTHAEHLEFGHNTYLLKNFLASKRALSQPPCDQGALMAAHSSARVPKYGFRNIIPN